MATKQIFTQAFKLIAVSIFCFHFSHAFNLLRNVDHLERVKRDDSSFLSGSGGPLASSGKDMNTTGGTGKCGWVRRLKQAIQEIAEDDPTEQGFKFLGNGECTTFVECESQCRRLSCNYFLKSSLNDKMAMYSVTDERLALKPLTESKTYDSFFNSCSMG